MSDERRGQVITFYSYKGGVGRSMAVANVATILAQQGHRVLVLDFDFEAPGLHRYFFSPDASLKLGGLIDFFHALRGSLSQRAQRRPATRLDWITAAVQAAWVRERYVNQVTLNYPGARRGAAVDFVAAGHFDDQYPGRVHGFDWKAFFHQYPEVFPILAAEWGRSHDYILIDSRTGVTDIGSICTMLLPEKLVLVFSPNNQSLNGALEVGEQAVRQRASSPDLRPLPLFPLLSRLENAEDELKRQWIHRARESFEAVFKRVYGLDECNLSAYFDRVRIPHTSFYAYDEKIAAERESIVEAQSMAAAYASFIECLGWDNPHAVPEASSRTVGEISKPPRPAQLYVCFSREDEALTMELLRGLRLLERASFVVVLQHDLATNPHTEKAALIQQADIILLMLSPAFLSSEEFHNEDMPWALREHERRDAVLVPLLLRPTDWKFLPLATLQVMPENGVPITRWSDRDEAWQQVSLELRRLIAQRNR